VPDFANVRDGINLSAGTGQAHTGTVVLSNSNGVTFGAQASASSTIVTMSAIAGLSSAIQSISAGTAMLTQGMVVFGNANGIVFGVNGQTITMGMNTASAWSNDPIPFDGQISIPGSSTTVNLSFQRVSFLAPINATRADMLLNMSVLGSTAGSFTISIGLYTFAGSTASSVSTTSAVVSWNSGTNTNVGSIYGGQSSLRWRSVALGTWNIVPGEYLVGVNISISGVAGSTAALTSCSKFATVPSEIGAPSTVSENSSTPRLLTPWQPLKYDSVPVKAGPTLWARISAGMVACVSTPQHGQLRPCA